MIDIIIDIAVICVLFSGRQFAICIASLTGLAKAHTLCSNNKFSRSKNIFMYCSMSAFLGFTAITSCHIIPEKVVSALWIACYFCVMNEQKGFDSRNRIIPSVKMNSLTTQ